MDRSEDKTEEKNKLAAGRQADKLTQNGSEVQTQQFPEQEAKTDTLLADSELIPLEPAAPTTMATSKHSDATILQPSRPTVTKEIGMPSRK